jgi:hypothetical protein
MGMRPGQTMAGGEQENVFATPAGHQAEIPAANGIMTARDLARMYACLGNGGELDGVRLMTPERVAIMSKQQTRRPDKVIVVEVGWALGRQMHSRWTSSGTAAPRSWLNPHGSARKGRPEPSPIPLANRN